MKKVALDCGHGKNSYPPSKGIGDFAEYDFNNQVGKYAKELAEFNGFTIILTQPFDSDDVGLKHRSNLANKEKCDLLFSIHADASDPKAEGHHAFYWYASNNSKRLAELWRKNANDILPNKDRGIRESKPNEWTNFHMVRETNMPAILIEHAFYTNMNELKLLKSNDFKKLCAKVIVKSMCDYFDVEFKEIPIQEEVNPTLIKLENGQIIRVEKQDNDYLIKLSDIESLIKPFEFVRPNITIPNENEDKEDVFMLLKKGMKGEKVRELQEKLNKLGYNVGSIDGDFGNKTYTQVMKFQKDNFNNPKDWDGIVGKATWNKVEELLNKQDDSVAEIIQPNTNKNSYAKAYTIGSTQIIECTPDRVNILEINKSLTNYTGGSGTFSWANKPNGILVNDGKIINQYSSHSWIGCPDSTLCFYKDGTVGIEELIDVTKVSKPLIWAISGIGLKGDTEAEFKKYGAEQGYKIFYVDGKKYNHTDIFRHTNHNSIGFKYEDGIYKIFYYRKTSCRRFRTVESAKNLKLDGAIGLDSGHISAINVDKFKANTYQKQNNIVHIKF